MSYDFSFIPNRRGSGSPKWKAIEMNSEYANAFPFSTADMEWGTAPAIREACVEFSKKGFFCYTEPDETYRKVVCDFMSRRHNWNIKPEWIVCTYGIVSTINTAVRCFTNEGDGIIIQRPVYYPFTAAIVNNNRKVANNALVLKDGKYTINFEELEALCKDENNKMMIICSPHNPVCRVWTKEELTKVADLCYENNILLVSDEIHFDITKNRHYVLTSLDEKYNKNTIVCTAASKSFNIAGLSTSNIIIANDELRKQFSAQISRDGYSCINCVAYPATIAAYTKCDEWLDEMNSQLNRNFKILKEYLKENLPEVRMAEHEGTYLAWLNVSCLGISDDELVDYISKNAGIIPSSGTWFGEEGSGFIRLNIAVPTQVLLDALSRLRKLADSRK